MNKLRNSFIALLSVIALNMGAQTVVTFDATTDKGTRNTDNPGSDQITKEGVTIAVSNGCMNLTDHYRCYAGADFSVSSTGDRILKVEITCTSKGDSKYGPGCLASPSEGTYVFEDSGSEGVWEGNAASFTMTATKQVRISRIVVTIGEVPDNPTFSVPAGVYFEPQTVELSAEAGTFILYTLNGDAPAYTDDTHFTGTKYDGNPLSISATTTVKAIAVNSKGKSSFIASATYNIVSIQGEVVIDATESKGSRSSSDPGDDQVIKDGITVAVSNGCMNLTDHYRCYADASFTITSTDYNIVKVEITCTANGDAKYGPGCLVLPSTGKYSFEPESPVGTWIGQASSFTLSATKQVRIQKIVVTYDDTPVAPTFSLKEGLYFNTQQVALESGFNTTIIYTTNGDDPAYTDDSHFTGTKYDSSNPLSISATTTVKAIAVSSKGKVSDIVSAVYSIVNTEGHGTVESPFTVADALVVLNALSDVGVTTNYYTKGYVIGDITVSEDGRASFQISDKADAPTGMMNVYMANGLEEGVYTEGDMKAGDEVVICAKMMYYGTSPEFYPGYIYSINGKTSKTSGIQTITAEKLKNTAVYNMQGVRVNKSQKGLFIINGKKVVK